MSESEKIGPKKLHLKIPDNCLSELRTIAEENGLTLTAVARIAIVDYVRRNESTNLALRAPRLSSCHGEEKE